jgi:hypothetical protein
MISSNMGKLYILIFSILFAWSANGQLNDTSCVQTKWCQVSRQEKPEIFDTTTFNLIDSIKHKVYSRQMKIYSENVLLSNKGDLKEIPYVEVELNKKTKDTIYKKPISDYFEIRIEYLNPLLDNDGEPLIHTNKKGKKIFIYPDPEIYKFTMDFVDVIRIREEKTYDSTSNSFQFRPIAFCLNLDYDIYGQELFWVYFKDLKDAFQGIDKIPIIEMLETKTYDCKQYDFIPCK